MEPTDDTDNLTICRNRATTPLEIWLTLEPVACDAIDNIRGVSPPHIRLR